MFINESINEIHKRRTKGEREMSWKSFSTILFMGFYVAIGIWQDPNMERMFPLFYLLIALELFVLFFLFKMEEYSEREVKA